MPRTVMIPALLLFLTTLVFAQGSNVGSAVSIAPVGTASGTINDQSTNHYWKVTTTTDGYLRLQINSASTIDVDATFYDTDGTSFISGDGQYGTYSEVFGFLRPGTYYLYVHRYTGTSGSYTITSSFVSPSRALETESNDTPATGVPLSPTGTSTGHLGFMTAGKTDTEDYWKITTTQDGWLRIKVISDSLDLRGDQSYDLDVTLYDINGTSSLSSDGRYGTFSQVDAFVRPGTYYVRVNRWQGRGGSYDIKSEFFTPTLGNDTEGNDSPGTASAATINGSVTGHLGYQSNGTTDTQDYWKFTTSADGKVIVRAVSDSLDRSNSRYDLDLTVYDINGTSTIASDGRTGSVSECIVYLRPGTYYARLNRWNGYGASYTLTITHTSPSRANDVEGNEWYAQSTPLTFNATATGHLGYQSNSFTDNRDIWRVVAPSTDSIYFHVTSDSTVDLDLTIYSQDSTTTINSDSRSGTYSRVGIKATAGSAYYAKVNLWTGTAGSYSLLATRSAVAVSVGKMNEALIPTELAMDQNYPNPFNPSTTIRYSLPESQKVRVGVFSVIGQEIAVLVNGIQPASMHTVVWNGKDGNGREMPSGFYIIRLQAGERQIVKKALLLR